jgi:hypothetical protein
MDLTRRDAVAALAAIGAGGVGAVGLQRSTTGDDTPSVDTELVGETLVAAAEAVYPTEVTGIETFVETFMAGRLDDGPHAHGVAEAVDALDQRAHSWYDDSFGALSVEDRDSLLGETGADTAEENPDGSTAEQIRYYVINELLLALYSSPTGGELVGIENPQGYAGGVDTYQRGPNA